MKYLGFSNKFINVQYYCEKKNSPLDLDDFPNLWYTVYKPYYV